MPPDEATYAVRSHLSASLRRKLGGKIGAIAFEAIEREPFDPLRAALTDAAVDSLAEARRAAFAQAGLPIPVPLATRVPTRRDSALLDYCFELLESDATTTHDHFGLRHAAEELHDRVKTFLDKRGEWPILSDAELELNAKPAAIVLLEWERCDDETSHSGWGALLRSLIQIR